MKFGAYPNVYKALVFLGCNLNAVVLDPEIPPTWLGLVEMAENELCMYTDQEIEAMAVKGDRIDECLNTYHLLEACMDGDGVKVFD